MRSRLGADGRLLALSYGTVYRNDEIDRGHHPAFHQIDGLSVTRRSVREYTVDDLVDVLVGIARSVYGPGVRTNVEPDTFPFTDPSVELQIEWKGTWTEVLGAGLVHTNTLRLLGIDPSQYNGWAFGFGLDRLAMIKMDIPDIRVLWSNDERIVRQFTGIDSVYHDVSRYPATDRDISFVAGRDLPVNRIYEVMRECGGDGGQGMIEEVRMIDRYDNERKFGAGRTSFTFRITYRSLDRTLTGDEINAVQERLRLRVAEELGAVLR